MIGLRIIKAMRIQYKDKKMDRIEKEMRIYFNRCQYAGLLKSRESIESMCHTYGYHFFSLGIRMNDCLYKMLKVIPLLGRRIPENFIENELINANKEKRQLNI
jgi:hypothetical protein